MTMAASDKIEGILNKALERSALGTGEIKLLLELKSAKDIRRLAACARSLRRRYFGNQVFYYGFLYFSTHCRNDCRFCQYRRSNTALRRYRKTDTEVLEAALKLAASGVHLLDLTMGEDPFYFDTPGGFDSLLTMISRVKNETGLPIMVSPGVVPNRVLAGLAQAGVDWYACYQETHNSNLFQQLRGGQSFQRRLEKKTTAKSLGLLIEEGILCGIGESKQDLAQSLAAMQSLEADQVRVMGLVPQKNTPLQDVPPPDATRETLIISVMRLVFADRLIPASLDVDGLKGLQRRLDAGANVVTSLVPPGEGLAGVAHRRLDIEQARRSAAAVASVVAACGLEPASIEQYRAWMHSQKRSPA